MPDRLDVTFFIDPGCPFGYSAWPALTALRWRYGSQLRWRPVMIGLAEDPSEYEEKGYDTLFFATSQLRFRRHGMPFSPAVKERVWATSPACRAIVAVRRSWPEREIGALRALQFAQFTSDMLLDRPDDLRAALEPLGLADIVDEIDSVEVWADYSRDRDEARSALGGPAFAQGKTAGERYTAPSLIFSRGGTSLEAGGFQPLEAYDVLLANLAPELDRREAPGDVDELLAAFPYPLATAEVAAVVGDDAEERLLGRMADGTVARAPLGDRALWTPARRGGRFTDTRGRGFVRNVSSST
jgi:2-hydroxychromene-2-carboxylate isomerase